MYPRLNSNQAKKVRDEILAARNENLSFAALVDQNLKNLLQNVEQGESLVETTIEQLYFQAKAIQKDIAARDLIAKRKTEAITEATAKGEYLEELMTEHLHRALDSVDPRALHDAGFWRFLALFPYRWYLLEREPEMRDNDFGGGEGSKRYWLLLRTFVIGRKSRSVGVLDEYVNTRAYRDARRRRGFSDGYWVDFYHSHIARKKWHDCVNVSNAYISSCVTAPEALDIDNESKRYAGSLAKRLLRISPNILLETLPSAELRDLIDREKNKVLGL